MSNTGNDAGSCTHLFCKTIKYAISRASAGDIIDVAKGTYTEPGLVIDADLTIRGHGASSTIIQAATKANSATGRVLTIGKTKKVTVSLEKVTVRYGKSSFGGGIYVGNGSVVKISDTDVVDNVATGTSGIESGVGGGIFVYDNGTVTIINSKISKNTAFAPVSVSLSSGGGIFSYCFTTLTIENSTISENKAGSHGGGIYISAPSTLIVKDSIISKNEITGGTGGGISNGDKATITDTVISGNAATLGHGGGISNSGPMTITGGTITDNGAGAGGGVSNSGQLTIRDSTLSDNGAYHAGGLEQWGNKNNSVAIVNSTLSGNRAQDGGAIINGGLLAMSNSTVANNATNAVHQDNAGLVNSGTATIKNSIIGGNLAGGINPGNNCSGKGTLKAVGVNLSTDATCTGFTQVTTASLNLAPLKKNPPGETSTQALEAGSAAIDAASDCKDLNGKILLTDQRGITRPQPKTGKCDVGAYERNGLTTTAGDINHDGMVNVIDARMAHQLVNQSAPFVKSADWNGNGEVDLLDVMAISSKSIGLITGPYALSLSRAGTGGGTVVSTPLGIDCGTNCAIGFAGGTKVVLIATPDALSVIDGWEGCNSTSYDECIVDMNSDRAVKARFEVKTKLGTGRTGPTRPVPGPDNL